MNPFAGANANHVLHQNDRDMMNFTYTPDLGDAPDPFAKGKVKVKKFNKYPSLVHSTDKKLDGMGNPVKLNGIQLFKPAAGAEHLFGYFGSGPAPRYQYEWLGKDPGGRIDDSPLECEARVPDKDAFDDGVTDRFGKPLVALVAGKKVPLTVHVRTAADIVGGGGPTPTPVPVPRGCT